jgi:phosphohistidine swiveling domain-containing protein
MKDQGIDVVLNNEPYHLHFRQTDFPFIFTDVCFRRENYGQFDYVVLQEKDQVTGYLSVEGKKQAHQLGLNLLDEEYSLSVLNELRGLLFELEDNTFRSKLDERASESLLSRWNVIEDMCNKVCRLYLYCEQPVQVVLEEIISKACGTDENLIRALHDPEYAEDLNFNEQQVKQLARLNEFGKLKFSIHNSLGKLFECLVNFMQEMADKFYLSLEQSLSLRDSEIKDILSGNTLPDKDILNDRINGLVFLPYRGEKGVILTGEKYRLWKGVLEPKNISEVKGNVAFRGKVQGRVKLHLSVIGGADLPDGTVLVSGMTNPQIIPFLKNVVAIVTDEGGLTCHAAIISRELKIPCIVGTKLATQILKDGDMVEVDAEKGIVRKI